MGNNYQDGVLTYLNSNLSSFNNPIISGDSAVVSELKKLQEINIQQANEIKKMRKDNELKVGA